MSELKPCPFCGGEAEVSVCRDVYQAWSSHCSTIQMGSFYKTKQAAIAAWNRREGKDTNAND